MAEFVITLDNTSPLITYSPSDWFPGAVNSSMYSLGTYTFSNTSGASTSFTFNGTGIWVYGSTGPSNAPCSVQIDGGTATNVARTTPSTSFQVPFYNNQYLSLGTHTITLTNEAVDPGASFFDIDFIMIQTQDRESTDQPSSQLYPATKSPPYVFGGPGWSSAENDAELPTKIGMFTGNYGDLFSLSFEVSNAVQVFGSVCPTCGQYQVQVDGGTTYTYNSSNVNNQTAQILFSGSNYEEGLHVLTVTKSDPDKSKVLIIDHVETESMPSISNSNATNSNESKQDSKPVSSKSAGPSAAVVGGLCAALVVTLFIFGVSVILYRRRRGTPPSSPASEKDSLGKIEAFYIDVDESFRSRSQSRQTHTRSNASFTTSGVPSPSTGSSRTWLHEPHSSTRPGTSSRNSRPSNAASGGNERRSTNSRGGPPRRRRTLRNSRILRAGYNLFFAPLGSSVSGSNLAPTTVLTTEISERPTTTLSYVSEAPPPLPPSNRSSASRPDSIQPLHVVNLADD